MDVIFRYLSVNPFSGANDHLTVVHSHQHLPKQHLGEESIEI